MGTLSKRRLEDFGVDVKGRVERFRSTVGKKLDDVTDEVDVKNRREGAFTRSIEKLSAALPSTTWLAFAGASAVASVALQLSRKKHGALFIATWVPSFLLLGVYNKLVKVAGSDRLSEADGFDGHAPRRRR
ncbi:MAG TPA: hypothetical protein VL326_26525 [Kofleriaceae bacterium]|nr:hypothetical protein [Kofleriaceae bacterium]